MATLSPGGIGEFTFYITPKNANTNTASTITDDITISGNGITKHFAAAQEVASYLNFVEYYISGGTKTSMTASQSIINLDATYGKPSTSAGTSKLIIKYSTNYPSCVFLTAPESDMYTSASIDDSAQYIVLDNFKYNDTTSAKSIKLKLYLNVYGTTSTSSPSNETPNATTDPAVTVERELTINQAANTDIIAINTNPATDTSYVPSGGSFTITSEKKVYREVSYIIDCGGKASGSTTYTYTVTGAIASYDTTNKRINITQPATSTTATITVSLKASTSASTNALSVKVYSVDGNTSLAGKTGNLGSTARTFTVVKRVLTVSSTSLTYNTTGETKSVTITSNVPWSATVATGSEYVTETPSTGGSYSVSTTTSNASITMTPYQSESPARTGSVKFTDTGYTSLTQTVNVSQTPVILTVNPTSHTFKDYQSGEKYQIEFSVSANTNFVITYDDAKFTITKKNS